MKLQIGAGSRSIPGFVNIDPRPAPGVTRGHAHDLPVPDGTVDVIFLNAVFEHLFLCHQIMALREWERVLSPSGVVVCTGVPDFENVARCYIDKTQGPTRPVFDLLEVYRYTHGFPEAQVYVDWLHHDPAATPDTAPAGWLPYLHKSLFDANSIKGTCDAAVPNLHYGVFRYCFGDEPVAVSLGIVLSKQPVDLDSALQQVPGIDDYVRLDTFEVL